MDLLQIGQKLNISIINNDKLVEIACTILKVFDDRVVLELPPYFMRYIHLLEAGSHITAKVFSKLGTIDFNSVVISSPLEEEFMIEFDYNAIRFTPNKELPIVNAMEKLRIKIDENIFIVKTFEISTEYLKFYSDKNFSPGDSFNCDLILPQDYDTISFRATVTERDPEYNNEYTVSYSNMTEYSRQTLLYYMYVYANDSDRD